MKLIFDDSVQDLNTTYFTSLTFIFPVEPATVAPGFVAVIPYTLSGLPASVKPEPLVEPALAPTTMPPLTDMR